MTKRYFYEFSGRVFIQADNKSQAVNAVTGITLSDYLINEDVYEVDENYVSHDLNIGEKQFGTIRHPLDDPAEFEEYKKRFCRYNDIFKDFLNGKIDKNELFKKMDQAETNDDLIDDCKTYAEISMIDLKTKKYKIARLIAVD